jgi:hypothetical protein
MNKVFNEFGVLRRDNGVAQMVDKALMACETELDKIVAAYDFTPIEMRCLADYVTLSFQSHISTEVMRKGIAMRKTVNPKYKKPSEWAELTGVEILDPDGWRNGGPSWETPIPWDMFLSRYNESTVRVVDKVRYKAYQYLYI